MSNRRSRLQGMNEEKANMKAEDPEELIQGSAEKTDTNAANMAAEDINPPAGGEAEALRKQLGEMEKQLAEKTAQNDDYLNRLQRTAAEFDNFKKRTSREKECLYSDAVGDIVGSFLPVIDSIEKALESCRKDDDFKSLKDGVELINRQFRDVLKNIGVEEIKCVNECFDPQLHSGVMHVEDDSCGQNTVVEEFRKGYIYKEKVIRHSMVKVAN